MATTSLPLILVGAVKQLLSPVPATPPLPAEGFGWEAEPVRFDLGGGFAVWTVPVGRAWVRKRHMALEPALADKPAGVRMMALLADSTPAGWGPIYTFVIEAGDKRILVDTGESVDFGSKAYFAGVPAMTRRAIVRVAHLETERAFDLTPQLGRCGLEPEDLDLVVLTHLHSDHAANADQVAGRPVVYHRDEESELKDSARMPQKVPAASPRIYFDPKPMALFSAFEAAHSLTEDGRVLAVHTPGHTRGHLSVIVEGADRTVVIGGDAAFYEGQLSEETVGAVFEQPGATRESMRKVRTLLDRSGAIGLFTHDPENNERLRTAEA